MSAFDVVVIGAGPAGYVCAIRCAQLGMKVALVEKRAAGKDAALGGTCLNVGCIPSKALLESSYKYHEVAHEMEGHGISVGKVSLDVKAMLARKDKVVAQLVGGVGMLMKKNKIEVVRGTAQISKAEEVLVFDSAEEGASSASASLDASAARGLSAKHIVIATGSAPVELPFAKFDHEVVIDSTDALSLEKVPEHMVVIGAGVIGLEMGSVWQRLGAKVTLVDVAERPVAVMDADLGEGARKIFEKQGLGFVLGAAVKSVAVKGKKATVTVEQAGKTLELEADKVLVSVGRRAYTDGLGLDTLGVAVDKRGVIQIDGHYATNVAGIYAIGDCAPGPMLAHKGEEEGVALAEMLAGQSGHVNYRAIPWVVYTHPEIAGVGLTEEEAKAERGEVKVGVFKFIANGRAIAVGATDGFVKVIADAETDEMLGVHILGHNASEMIAEAAVLMEFKASAEDMARCCHAHPTMSEAVKEAALAVAQRAIHS